MLLLALVLPWQGKERKPMGQREKLDAGALTADFSRAPWDGDGPSGLSRIGAMRGQTLVSLAGPCAPLRAACTCVFISQPQGTTSHRDTSSFMLVIRNRRRQTAKPEGGWEWVVGADTNPASSIWGSGHALGAPGVSPTSPSRSTPSGVAGPRGCVLPWVGMQQPRTRC